MPTDERRLLNVRRAPWRKRILKRRTRKAGLIGLVVTIVLLLPITEDWLVYRRGGRYHPPAPDFERVEAWPETSDGVRLHAWFCPCPPEMAAPEHERLTVIYFHGTFGELTWRQRIARRWQEALGADILLLDYRGYGLSEGQPSEDGLYRDARAAYRWLISERGIDPNRIVLVGRSLGAAVALELAVEVKPRAVVLESSFTDMHQAAQDLCLSLPVGLVMHNHFPSLERVRLLDRPILIAHGDDDRIIPVAHSFRLYEAAKSPKRLLILPGGHGDFPDEGFYVAVHEFLQSNP